MFIDAPPFSADIVVVGGGTAGLSLASRLSKAKPSLDVLVIESGPDSSGHPFTSTPSGAFAVAGSELDWNYRSTPQRTLNNRELPLSAGKTLSGATAINYGLWLRGSSADYDRWAMVVGDSNWSYSALLPYSKDLEKHFDLEGDRAQHGFDGPMRTMSVSLSDPTRRYPLRPRVRDAWNELGVDINPDCNSGLGEIFENWHNDGTSVIATKEVILSTGAYRTPQILMHSGIGPMSTLENHNILVPVHVSNSEIGRNIHDHLVVPIYWKLRNPELGLAMGSPAFNSSGLEREIPFDFVAYQQTPESILRQALDADHDDPTSCFDPQSLLKEGRIHTEFLVTYLPVAKPGLLSLDGTIITTSVLCMQPTSRGTVTISFSDPADPPVIDCNFYSTAVDRAVMRDGIRSVLSLMQSTQAGISMVESEVPLDDCPTLHHSQSSDSQIDARVRQTGEIYNHPAGTAAMGKVVDTRYRVTGLQGLRVVGASILPIPITAHYMVCMYTVGERVADLIVEDLEGHLRDD